MSTTKFTRTGRKRAGKLNRRETNKASGKMLRRIFHKPSGNHSEKGQKYQNKARF